MVQNIWIRSKEFANFLGLLLGGLAITITGNDLPDTWIFELGIGASGLFAVLCLITIILGIRDAIFHPENFFVGLQLRG